MLLKRKLDSSSVVDAVVLPIIGFTFWCFSLWRSICVFAPAKEYAHFNSDDAILILAANDSRPITAFNIFYYGSDKWEGWLFLVTHYPQFKLFKTSFPAIFKLSHPLPMLGRIWHINDNPH